jgi:uncharacterized membrane protein
MNDWKWTTKVGLVVALLVIGFSVFGAYQYADENDLYFTPNSGGIMLNLLLWWALVKWVLDAAVWLRGKFR